MLATTLYTTLEESVRTSGRGVFSKISQDNPEKLSEWLETSFLINASQHNDPQAMIDLGLLMKSIEEKELKPFLIFNDKRGWELPHDWNLPPLKQAKYNIVINRAKKAQGLFPQIPSHRTGKRGGRVDDVYREFDVTESVLPGTKGALLLDIAEGWKTSTDEQEAQTFFNFILTWQTIEDEGELKHNVLRKVTDTSFPKQRLVHTLAHFTNCSINKRVMEILLQGWMKQVHGYDIMCLFSLFEPISIPSKHNREFSSSAALFELATEQLTTLKTLDNKILEMIHKTLSGSGISWKYIQNPLSPVIVEITWKEEIVNVERQGNEIHEQFEKKKTQMKAWLDANREKLLFRVIFKLMGKDRYSDKVLISREAAI